MRIHLPSVLGSGQGWPPGPIRTGMLAEEGPMDVPLEPLAALKCRGEPAP